MIVDGKVKLKNDSLIKQLTEGGIEFENGSTLPADVVILATGCVTRNLRSRDINRNIRRLSAMKVQ